MFNGLNIGPAMKRCTFFLLFEFPVPFYGCAAYLAKNGAQGHFSADFRGQFRVKVCKTHKINER